MVVQVPLELSHDLLCVGHCRVTITIPQHQIAEVLGLSVGCCHERVNHEFRVREWRRWLEKRLRKSSRAHGTLVEPQDLRVRIVLSHHASPPEPPTQPV
jgi:hypothetical protein